MTYLVFKVIHLTAMILWLGSLTLTSFLMTRGALVKDHLLVLRRVMLVGLVLTWAAGLWLTSQGGWLSAPWLRHKLIIVLLLSLCHGLLLGVLWRRQDQETKVIHPIWKILPYVILVSVFGSVLLATLKLG